MTIKCDWCGEQVSFNDSEILAKLDPKYPAQTETITCPRCGTQLIMQARKIMKIRGQL
jgi:DNA-directed RNA polymerase subunit RPC12/RpoP